MDRSVSGKVLLGSCSALSLSHFLSPSFCCGFLSVFSESVRVTTFLWTTHTCQSNGSRHALCQTLLLTLFISITPSHLLSTSLSTEMKLSQWEISLPPHFQLPPSSPSLHNFLFFPPADLSCTFKCDLIITCPGAHTTTLCPLVQSSASVKQLVAVWRNLINSTSAATKKVDSLFV